MGKSDPYVMVCYTGRDEAEPLCQTLTIDNDSDPVWNEEFEILWDGKTGLDFGVWDKDIVGADFLGRAALTSDQIAHGYNGALKLLAGNGRKDREEGAGALTIRVIP